MPGPDGPPATVELGQGPSPWQPLTDGQRMPIIPGSQGLPMLVFAFFIRGLKEFGEPTRKALILDLADEEHKGAVYGAYYLLRDSFVSVAAFAGGPLWLLSPTANLLAASAFGLAGTAYFVAFCEE